MIVYESFQISFSQAGNSIQILSTVVIPFSLKAKYNKIFIKYLTVCGNWNDGGVVKPLAISARLTDVPAHTTSISIGTITNPGFTGNPLIEVTKKNAINIPNVRSGCHYQGEPIEINDSFGLILIVSPDTVIAPGDYLYFDITIGYSI